MPLCSLLVATPVFLHRNSAPSEVRRAEVHNEQQRSSAAIIQRTANNSYTRSEHPDHAPGLHAPSSCWKVSGHEQHATTEAEREPLARKRRLRRRTRLLCASCLACACACVALRRVGAARLGTAAQLTPVLAAAAAPLPPLLVLVCRRVDWSAQQIPRRLHRGTGCRATQIRVSEGKEDAVQPQQQE